jgi:hypothetical protein
VALAVEIELGIEVLPLTFVGDEIVESGPRLVVALAHVPLAHVRGVIPGALQDLREGFERGGKLGEVVGDAVPVRVHAAQQRGPARRAQRRGREGVAEVDSFVGDAIDLRRPQVRVSGIPERIPAQIVEQDHQDIRPTWRIDHAPCAATGRGYNECRRDGGEDDGSSLHGTHYRCLSFRLKPEATKSTSVASAFSGSREEDR